MQSSTVIAINPALGQKVLAGLDLASKIIQVAFKDDTGIHNLALRKTDFVSFLEQNLGKPVVFAMEACGGSNFWARYLESLGYEACIFPARVCRKHNWANKDDKHDAAGVYQTLFIYRNCPELATFKPCIKRSIQSQQAMFLLKSYHENKASLTRILRNLIAFLREQNPLGDYSYSMGVKAVQHAVEEFVAGLDEQDFCQQALKDHLLTQLTELAVIEKRQHDLRLNFFGKYVEQHPVCQKLMQIDGVGVNLAVAVSVITDDDFSRFSSARDLCSYFGLVPEHAGTGGKNHTGRISSHGNTVAKALFFEAGNSVLCAKHRQLKNQAEVNEELQAEQSINVRDKRQKIKAGRQICEQMYYKLCPDKTEPHPNHSVNLDPKRARIKRSKFRSKVHKLEEILKKLLSNFYTFSVLFYCDPVFIRKLMVSFGMEYPVGGEGEEELMEKLYGFFRQVGKVEARSYAPVEG